MQVGAEEFHIKLTQDAAAKQKDALAKHIYSMLFDLCAPRVTRRQRRPQPGLLCQLHSLASSVPPAGLWGR